jgi:transcriptional regulator with XRE-family HTH domain
MAGKTPEEHEDAQLLSAAMRAIRKERRLRPSEMARLMEMPIRSYEHFEAGRGKLSFERIVKFAEVTNSDAIALLAVLPLGKPEFALHCADNKLMTIMMHAMGELEEQLGPDIAYLNSATMIGASSRIVKELIEHVRSRDTFADHWLEERGVRRDGGKKFGGWRRGKASRDQ